LDDLIQVAHRDLKPANILLSSDCKLKAAQPQPRRGETLPHGGWGPWTTIKHGDLTVKNQEKWWKRWKFCGIEPAKTVGFHGDTPWEYHGDILG